MRDGSDRSGPGDADGKPAVARTPAAVRLMPFRTLATAALVGAALLATPAVARDKKRYDPLKQPVPEWTPQLPCPVSGPIIVPGSGNRALEVLGGCATLVEAAAERPGDMADANGPGGDRLITPDGMTSLDPATAAFAGFGPAATGGVAPSEPGTVRVGDYRTASGMRVDRVAPVQPDPATGVGGGMGLETYPETMAVQMPGTLPGVPQPVLIPATPGAPGPAMQAIRADLVPGAVPVPQPAVLGIAAPSAMPRAGAIGLLSLGPVSYRTRYDEVIRRTAHAHRIDPLFLHAVITQESRYKERAVSHAGAVGMMQIMPATGRGLGLQPHQLTDPVRNIDAGARLLRRLAIKYDGNFDLVLAAYNAGEGAVAKYRNAIPPYRETQDYVVKVMGHYRKLAAEHGLVSQGAAR